MILEATGITLLGALVSASVILIIGNVHVRGGSQ